MIAGWMIPVSLKGRAHYCERFSDSERAFGRFGWALCRIGMWWVYAGDAAGAGVTRCKICERILAKRKEAAK